MANIRFFGNITPQAVQFENASGTETGRIGKSGDDLTITNAVGDVLFGDGLSDVYIGNGISSVDLLFEQSGAISAAAGSSITLTIGSADTTLALYAPTITNISTQASESTALMINGSNVVGTRELGSNAFNSTAYLPLAGGVMSGKIGRSSAIVGFLEGSYNNVGGNSTNTNPIYTIGSNYNPASTTLSNMYGVGYSNVAASFITLTGASDWGFYVAADGDARVWLDGSTGNISGAGNVYASGGNSTEWNTAYDNRITSLTTNGTSGVATLLSNVLNIPNYAGGQGVTSILTTNGITGGPISSTGTLQVDSTVIRTTGNQTIGGTKTFSSTIAGSINGNAATATVLQTARTIAGVSFNGSANISLNNNAITNGAGYITSASLPSVGNGTLTVQGTGVLGGSGTFTANQSGNSTISVTHDNSGATAGSYTNANITIDASGHVTAAANGSDDNTNYYTTTATFNTGNGVISFSGAGGQPAYSVDLDGRYAYSSDLSGYVTIGTTQTITGAKTFTNGATFGSGVTLTESTDRADLLYINSATSTWGGLQIGNTSNEFIFSLMGDGNVGGIYDDINSDWIIQWDENSAVRLYHNAVEKLATTSTGVSVTGIVAATGGNSTEWNTAYDNRITTLTTTGTSGAATLISNVLNIPNYADGQGVTSVGGTAPIVSSGGTTPDISITAATTGAAGSMSAADKAKLNGIAAGAQVNVGTNIAQGTRTTTTVPVTSSTGTNATLAAATTSLAGVMTSADKTKLDGIATGANTGTVTSVTAGSGMTQTGTSTVNPTLNVIGGTGITANADDVAITYVGSGNAILAAADNSGTTLATGAKIWFSDDGTIAQANVSDLPFTNNVGDITGVTAGTNLNGGGSSGSVMVNLDNDITINTVEYTYPTAVNQYRGEIVTFGNFNGTIAAGDVIVYTTAGLNSGWFLAQGSVAYGKGMLGVAMGTTPAAGILVKGFARNAAFTSGGLGSVLYLSPTSAGDTTLTIPSGSNNIVRIVGYMLNPTNDEIFFDPDKSWVQIV